ncbi:MAG: PQQ-like beta-propeller repeat protein, partial [Candidatus Heimdallarchaeota archaeon]|nr:PQQ-like beta-propeller repeat protein [Candidatus Heimdallarchaeota archaeon]MCK4876319.1 PQQ-like beta-propeller repeat protein [Candidatus Heimdallarchaeota archaeon]
MCKKSAIYLIVILFFTCGILSHSSTDLIEEEDNTLDVEISSNILTKEDLKLDFRLREKWSTRVVDTNNARSTPCIVDIDKDNLMEIVTGFQCLNYDGSLKWNTSELGYPAHRNPIAIDLDEDNDCEIIFGIYTGIVCLNSTGSVEWIFNASAPYIFYAQTPCIIDLDNDRKFEVIIGTENGTLFCLDCNGQKLWSYKDNYLDQT